MLSMKELLTVNLGYAYLVLGDYCKFVTRVQKLPVTQSLGNYLRNYA